jgi:hypothetical protein
MAMEGTRAGGGRNLIGVKVTKRKGRVVTRRVGISKNKENTTEVEEVMVITRTGKAIGTKGDMTMRVDTDIVGATLRRRVTGTVLVIMVITGTTVGTWVKCNFGL